MFKRRFVSVMLVAGILTGLAIGVAVGYAMGARAERTITQCGMVAIEKGPFNSLSYVLNPRGWEAHHVSSGETVWEYAKECAGFMREYVDIREVVQLILEYNDMRADDLRAGTIIYLPF